MVAINRTRSEKILIAISGILAGLSILFFILTVFFPGTLSKAGFTGFAIAGNTTAGIVNITIEQNLIINFTTDIIDWGSGRVDAGANNATLDTSRTTPATKMLNGNWTGGYTNKTKGLVLENIGNVNATIYIKTANNATTFLGGTNPLYQFNVSNNETGSCVNATGFALSAYLDVNYTAGDGTKICEPLKYLPTSNQIRIHVLLRVPTDSKTGTLNDTITATAVQTD